MESSARACARRGHLGAIAIACCVASSPAAAQEPSIDPAAAPVTTTREIGIARDEAAREAATTIREELRQRAAALDRTYPGPTTAPAGTRDLAWWTKQTGGPLFGGDAALDATLDSCYDRAIRHSTQIRVFADLPLIRETGIDEAEGMWTPRAFAEGKYERGNDPVGNILTTGGANRFKQHDWVGEAGVRKRFVTGAEAVVAQRFEYLNYNSIYFDPDPQTTSRLVVSVAQPLLKGMGITYNESLYDLARLDTEMAREEFRRQVESHLLEVTRSYWTLHLARAAWAQKQRLTEDTRTIASKLEARAGLDVDRAQLLRARASLADREADQLRAKIAVENSAAKLRALMNDPDIDRGAPVEIVPVDDPAMAYGDVSLRDVVLEAVERRPEIRQAYLQYEAAAVREGMARNEARHTLDLILEGSLGGIDGDAGVGQAWTDQWKSGPGGIIGLRYELPVGDGEEHARLARRRIEMRQQANQVRTTLNTVILEAEVSGNEYATAAAELDARVASLRAAVSDQEILRKRWQEGLGAGSVSGVSYLESLLDAQDRRAEAEARLVTAQAAYRVSVTNLERVKGRFLEVEGVEVVENRPEDELPTLDLRRSR
jgi:outer membrane protein TolC